MKRKKSCNIVAAVLFGVLTSAAVTIIVSIIATMMIHSGRAGGSAGVFTTSIAWLLGAISGCLTAGILSGDRAIIGIFIAAVGYFGILISLHILIFEGAYYNLILGMTIILVAALCSLWFLRGKKVTKKKKYRFKTK